MFTRDIKYINYLKVCKYLQGFATNFQSALFLTERKCLNVALLVQVALLDLAFLFAVILLPVNE